MKNFRCTQDRNFSKRSQTQVTGPKRCPVDCRLGDRQISLTTHPPCPGSFQRADAGRTKNRVLSPTSISTRTKRALLLSRKAKEKPNLFTKLRLLPPFKTTGVPSHRNLLLLFIHNAAVARRRQKIAAISNFWTGGTNRPGRRVNS